MYQRTRLGLGYLPQEPSIFRKLTVEDNLRAVLELRSLPRSVQDEKLEELLAEFNLEEVRSQRGAISCPVGGTAENGDSQGAGFGPCLFVFG